MCQCGCGDFNGDFKFKGPDGISYVLQVYPSCDNCNQPAGIILYAMGEKDCKEWDVENIPEVEITDIGTFFSVVHPKKIVEFVLHGVQQYIEDGLDYEFTSAVFAAIKDNKSLHGTEKDTRP